jgi:hypothetical protein
LKILRWLSFLQLYGGYWLFTVAFQGLLVPPTGTHLDFSIALRCSLLLLSISPTDNAAASDDDGNNEAAAGAVAAAAAAAAGRADGVVWGRCQAAKA